MANAISLCHLQWDLHSDLSFQPYFCLCSSQHKSPGLFQSPQGFLLPCQLYNAVSQPLWLIHLFSLQYHLVSKPKCLLQPQLHDLEVLNRNHVPAYPVSSSSSPVILKYISYLVILTLCPGIRCAHPVDFESSCQATLSLGSITISLQLIANIWCRVKCLQRAYM